MCVTPPPLVLGDGTEPAAGLSDEEPRCLLPALLILVMIRILILILILLVTRSFGEPWQRAATTSAWPNDDDDNYRLILLLLLLLLTFVIIMCFDNDSNKKAVLYLKEAREAQSRVLPGFLPVPKPKAERAVQTGRGQTRRRGKCF